MSSIIIRGAGHALPSKIVTNEDLELKVKNANAHWSKILTNANGEMHELWEQYFFYNKKQGL